MQMGVLLYNGFMPEIKDPPAPDVSHWKYPITFYALDPMPWLIFTKATEGENIIDSSFHEFWYSFLLYGIRRGAYHFLRPGDIGNNAQLFINIVTLERYTDRDFFVLDVEDVGNTSYDVIQFVDHVERETGIQPIVYSSAEIIRQILRGASPPAWFKDVKWWIAGYPNDPDPFTEIPDYYIPAGVPRENVIAWQYSEKGRWNGIPGNVDLNLLSQWWIEEIDLQPPQGVPMPDFRYSITPFYSNGCSIRADHNVYAAKVGALPYGEYAYGDVDWIAPENGDLVNAGDRWLQIVKPDGTVFGWIAEIHLGKRSATIVEINPPPIEPPPTGKPNQLSVDVDYVDGKLIGTVSGTAGGVDFLHEFT